MNTTTPFDVMVISAHPDDAEFGAAGTVAQWTRAGKQVAYVVCTSGEKGTSDPNVKPEHLAVTREKEQLAAAKVLGVSEIEFLRYPDQGLEDSHELRMAIVRVIRKYRPVTVLTTDPYRKYIWHRDHRILGQVTLDAVYPYARDHLSYPDLLEEGLKPHKVKELLFWGSDDINLRIDITDVFDKKLSALLCHESQVREMGIEHAEKWLRELCRSMAGGEKFEFGEAFHKIDIPR